MRTSVGMSWLLSVVGLSLLVALAACSSEETVETKQEEIQEAPKTTDEFKVGFVYVSPVGDAGWTYAHDKGRLAVEAEPGVSASYVESVPEGPDAERVIANMARKGFDLIFTTSYGYMDPTLKVAGDYPDVTFMHCSGYKTAPNMGNYFGRMYQARYLSGIVAGSMTASNILGYVAAFPIPEVIRGINAFALGAQSVNPDAQVRVVWTKTWYDPATEKEAAKSLLDVGSDVIAQHQDSPAAQEAAQERGVFSVGYNTDMSAFAPKAHLTAPIWNWETLYKDVLNDVRNGEWQSASIWWGLEKGVVDIAPFGPMVSQETKQLALNKRMEIINGEFSVFQGPIKDQDGEVRIPDGVVAGDELLLGMNWFVEGVIGSTE